MATEQQSFFEKLSEYDNHHKVVFLNDPKAALRGYIAIHRKHKAAPSFGATRLWHYKDSVDGLRDALRLSRMMSYKAAMAGLPCGGAKGIILAPEQPTAADRQRMLESYAEEVHSLHGEFITGTDVGIFADDLQRLRKISQYFVGINGDATEATALGVYVGMQTYIASLTGSKDLTGKAFAIQGVGKIGEALIALLYKEAARIYIADTDRAVLEKIIAKFPNLIVVSPEKIHTQAVDVFVPCALSHALNQKTVLELNCQAVVGGANNQLESETIGDLLHKLGILYAPDFVVNAGGLISVYDEYEHPNAYNRERVAEKVGRIGTTLEDILAESKNKNFAPNRVANSMAEGLLHQR